MTTSKRVALLVVLGAVMASAQDATKIEEKKTYDVKWSKQAGEPATFSFDVAKRGVFKLIVSRPRKDDHAPFDLHVVKGDEELYLYHALAETDDFQFFPVLDKGSYLFKAWTGAEPAPAPRLTIERFEPKLGDDEKKAARAAIEKATAFLMKGKPADQSGGNVLPIEGLVLAALCEGAPKERKDALEQDWVAWIESQNQETPGSWKGKKVFSPSQPLYEHSILTLGLADAASNGSAKAKALLPKMVEYLLAAQLTPIRCAEWGAAEGDWVGGWRYQPDSKDADISVTGWCLVALAAASAAGTEVEGTRDAIHSGVDFVLKCTCDAGFSYSPGSAKGNVRDAIGALVCLLNGEEPEALAQATDDLDAHLSAYTQTDVGEDYPLYYAYYATRADYLRGGFAWEAWRSTVVKQLLLRQTPEGTWPRWGSENALTDRYSAAVGILILRLCLEEVPAYLKREVKGF